MKKSFKKAQSGIEFLVVFSILLIFFVLVADIAIFFKEIYRVQMVADEAIAKLEAYHACANPSQASEYLISSVQNHYPGTVGIVNFSNTFSNAEPYRLSGTYTSTDSNARFKFTLRCRSKNVPSSIMFAYRHYGLFMFLGGKYVSSNVSSNTSL